MTVKERLTEYLKRKRISKSAFGREIGVSSAYITSIRKSIQPDKLQRIALKFPDLNTEWLLTGEGPMLKDDKANKPPHHVIRYWENIEATGGGIMSFDDALDGHYSEMVLPDFSDCTDAMRLVGDSMYPRYKSGQILIFKEWQEPFIEYGQAYLIITRSGYRMLKYLQPAPEKSRVTCVSENADKFPPFEIEIESIHRLYLVKGSVEQNAY